MHPHNANAVCASMLWCWQIYNVDKRIQEDNLQHLALFSEYGRMALDNQHAAGAVAAASGSAGHEVSVDQCYRIIISSSLQQQQQ